MRDLPVARASASPTCRPRRLRAALCARCHARATRGYTVRPDRARPSRPPVIRMSRSRTPTPDHVRDVRRRRRTTSRRRALPEIAVVGRSNVGKSSLINALVGQDGLARTSRTPGRTRLSTGSRSTRKPPFHLVDLPGYGYAEVPTGDARRAGSR